MAEKLTEEEIALDAEILKWETPAMHARMKSHAPRIALRYHGEVVRLRKLEAQAAAREAKLRELLAKWRADKGSINSQAFARELESILNEKGEA